MPDLPWCPASPVAVVVFVFRRPAQSSLISRLRELRAGFGLEPCGSIRVDPPDEFESGGRRFIGASGLGRSRVYEIRRDFGWTQFCAELVRPIWQQGSSGMGDRAAAAEDGKW